MPRNCPDPAGILCLPVPARSPDGAGGPAGPEPSPADPAGCRTARVLWAARVAMVAAALCVAASMPADLGDGLRATQEAARAALAVSLDGPGPIGQLP